MVVGAAPRGVATGTAGVAAVDTGAVEGSDGGKEAGGLGAAFPVRVVCREAGRLETVTRVRAMGAKARKRGRKGVGEPVVET